MLELLTVIALAAVLASLAIPSMRGFVQRTSTKGALDRVVADIGYTRMLAVQGGTGTTLRIHDDASYTIETRAVTGAPDVIRTVRLRDDYRGVTLGSTSNELHFNSRGLLLNQDGETTLEVARGEVRVSAFISAAGRVYRDY